MLSLIAFKGVVWRNSSFATWTRRPSGHSSSGRLVAAGPTEAEHRAILREAVAAPVRAAGLKDLIESMPAVGEDADFERPRDLGRRTRL